MAVFERVDAIEETYEYRGQKGLQIKRHSINGKESEDVLSQKRKLEYIGHTLRDLLQSVLQGKRNVVRLIRKLRGVIWMQQPRSTKCA